MDTTKLKLYLLEITEIKGLQERINNFWAHKAEEETNEEEKLKSIQEMNLGHLMIDLKSTESQLFHLIKLELDQQIRNARNTIDELYSVLDDEADFDALFG